mgnify:CR=1 FL=1
MSEFPTSARCVIIGAGIVGNCLAAHLSDLGWTDMVLIDKTSGVMFAGGLVFADRMPTTPHAEPKAWLQSLEKLAAMNVRITVPSHGPVHSGAKGIQQTRAYLQWVDQSFSQWARDGWDMNEVLRLDVPAEFRAWAAFGTEYTRNVAHLYPRYEQAVIGALTDGRALTPDLGGTATTEAVADAVVARVNDRTNTSQI